MLNPRPRGLSPQGKELTISEVLKLKIPHSPKPLELAINSELVTPNPKAQAPNPNLGEECLGRRSHKVH